MALPLLPVLLVAPSAAACAIGRAQGCVEVTVAAAAEVASAVQAAATRFSATERPGRCVRVKVEGRDPDGVVSALAAGRSGKAPRIDAWIPDSSLWIPMARRTRSGRDDVAANGTSIASTPVVWATTSAQARRWAAQGVQANWRSLVPEAAISQARPVRADGTEPNPVVPEPGHNAAGMAAVLAAYRLAGQEERGLVRLSLAMIRLRSLIVNDIDATYTAMIRDPRRPVAGVTTEQSVVGHNRRAGARQVVAQYPVEGTLSLDYPYVITTRDRARAEAAAAFGVALRDRATVADLLGKGFRGPDGAPGGVLGPQTGTTARPPGQFTLPDADTLVRLRDMWDRARLGVRALDVLDVSAAMGRKTQGTDLTRLQAGSEWFRQYVGLSPDTAEIGFWEFGERLDDAFDRRVVVPIQRLDAATGKTTQRERLLDAVGAARTERSPRRGLLDTVLAAFRAMQRDYRPDRYNVINIVTDGTDSDPDGVVLDQLLGLMEQETDPRQPIDLIISVYDPKADLTPLRRIVERTGGRVYSARDLQFADAVHCDMLVRTLCTGPACPRM